MASQQVLQTLALHLRNSISPDGKSRQAAEDFLKNAELQNGFSVTILQLVSMKNIPAQPTRVAGAVILKNFVKKYWVVGEDEKDRIHPDDRNRLKKNITDVMLNSEQKIRTQLGEAIHLICKQDFPAKWQGFLPDIISKLKQRKDAATISTVLEVLEMVVRRYRFEAASNRLWEEIKFVMDNFQDTLLGILEYLTGMIDGQKQNAAALASIFKCLDTVCQIFYSLSSQTIPEYFEDNINKFMKCYMYLINYYNPLLTPRDTDEPGPLENTKGGVCDIVRLYANKYDEEFKNWVPKFVENVWSMLTKTDEKGMYDQVVPKAIQFLTAVVEKEWHKNLFGNAQSIKVFAEKVIIPQLKLRDSDLEDFEVNGIEYLRRDIEGSDSETRRRTTVNFVRGLCKFFEKEVTLILQGYVDQQLKLYQSNPSKNWMAKDVAMYIVVALAVRGSTRAKGATQLNPFINVAQFFSKQVVPELKGNIKENPVLKADCLKFVAVFRTHLPVEAYLALLPIIARYLEHPNYVVHSYAAISIERMLAVKERGKPKLTKAHIKPFVKPLMSGLFTIFKHEESTENEYGMRAVMRLCSTGEEVLASITGAVIENITSILSKVAQNPRNPHFNHYLFETLACLINNICKADKSAIGSFEKALFPPFEQMLGMETCQEFGPYVFQILSQLLEKHTRMTGPYKNIFGALLHPQMWANKGNIPAMIRLLIAYLRVDHTIVGNKIEGLLGIFQKLISNKREDHHGMALIGAIIEFMPLEMWSKYATTAFGMMFARLSGKSKTQKFSCNFVSLVAFFCHKHGADTLVNLINAVQKGIFPELATQVIIPNIQYVQGDVERKSCAVGMVDLLCKSSTMLSAGPAWLQLLIAIVRLFELPESNTYEEEDVLDVSQRGFKTVYCRLAFAPEVVHDPVGDIADAKKYMAQGLASLSQKMPGKVPGMIAKLEPNYQNAIRQYLQGAGVSLQ